MNELEAQVHKMQVLKKELGIVMNELYTSLYDKSKQVSVSLFERQKILIDLLSKYKFEENRSEFIRKAVDFYLIHCLGLVENPKRIVKKLLRIKKKDPIYKVIGEA